jgi:hypothetical protein
VLCYNATPAVVDDRPWTGRVRSVTVRAVRFLKEWFAKVPTKTLAILGTVGGVAAAALFFAVLAVSDSGPERPQVTDWMQAWSSIGALVAGTAAAIFTAGLLLHEMRQAREARAGELEARADAARERELAAADRARIEQDRLNALKAPARNVMAGGIGASGQPSLGYMTDVSVGVNNYGPTPIRDVVVTLVSANECLTLAPIAAIRGEGVESARRTFGPPPGLYSRRSPASPVPALKCGSPTSMASGGNGLTTRSPRR